MEEKQKQEMYMKATMLQQQSQEVEQNLILIETQILELTKFSEELLVLDSSKEKEVLASLGRGVFIKTSLENKDLLVDVGSGVLVKKTPKEAVKIIDEQLVKLNEAKTQLQSQLELFQGEFANLIQEVEKIKSKK